MIRRSLIGVIVVALLLTLAQPHRTSAQSPTPSTTSLPCYAQTATAQMRFTPPPNVPTMPPSYPTAIPSSAASAIAFGKAQAAAAGYAFPSPGSTGPITCPSPGNGSALLKAIWTAANAYRGTSTAWAGTSCGNPIAAPDHLGNCACAAAVQRIVRNATGQTIGTYGVDSWQTMAITSQYGGGIVQPMASHAGDIIIWIDNHMGICADDGCTQTWSNSSSQSKFAPYTSDVTFGGAFTSYIIYEPQQI